MGLARDGSTSGNGSGDLFIALSTANPSAAAATGVSQLAMLPNDRMNPLFETIIQATEETILNAMFAAETMVGRDDRKVDALPVDRVRAILKKNTTGWRNRSREPTPANGRPAEFPRRRIRRRQCRSPPLS